jgi:hypothetical protein
MAEETLKSREARLRAWNDWHATKQWAERARFLQNHSIGGICYQAGATAQLVRSAPTLQATSRQHQPSRRRRGRCFRAPRREDAEQQVLLVVRQCKRSGPSDEPVPSGDPEGEAGGDSGGAGREA